MFFGAIETARSMKWGSTPARIYSPMLTWFAIQRIAPGNGNGLVKVAL